MVARYRARLARQALSSCRLCAHDCGVNRLDGDRGFCRAGPTARIFSAQTEVSDELELSPVFAIAFSGCDLRCDFCITGAESWNPAAGVPMRFEEIASQAENALDRGARTIMFLGGEPTIHLPSVLEVVSLLPEDAILVWKTNAHGSAEARALLDGLFDIWVADYKFGNDECARRLAKVDNYGAIVRENLAWAAVHADLIVRHLVMPGHVDCCWRPVAEWLGSDLPGVKVNLRTGFWPAWHARRHSEMRSPTSGAEAQCAVGIAQEFGLRLVD